MQVDLTQQDLVCLVLGSMPPEMKDCDYLVEAGYMNSYGGHGGQDYKWNRDAVKNLSDIALYGLFNLVKKGNIREYCGNLTKQMK